jgi:putative two-component system response regulator
MKEKPVILIVDDQPQNNELLEALLVPQGYEIVKAVSGNEALEKLAGNQIDLMLLDVMMPGMDGFEVTRRVRQDDKNKLLPIILVTALRETEDRVKGIEAGGDDFLSKPVDKMELSARVKSLLKVKAYNDLMSNYRKELESEVAGRTEELKHAFEKIKAASLETIYRLSMASEYKDEDTGAHIKRMSRYCEAVARRMGLDEGTIETILYAAPMHDLGKIGIPDVILTKPAKLNPGEWEIMKLHTVIGANILKGSDAEFIRLGESIAQNHHEKWDGSGYPNNLKGVEIPIAGRIAAIADVFDALTSKRPYKEPFSVEKSLAIIREGKGSHFDPEVVDAFFAIQDEILAIKAQYSEDNLQAFDIPELKTLLQQYNREELLKEPKMSEIEWEKSQDLINASEVRYRRLFEASREGILILDAEKGQIVDVNPFLIEMLGYSKEELLGKKLWEISPFKDIVASKQSFMELQSKKYVRYEDIPLQRNDGKLVNVEFISVVYDVYNKKVIQCNIRDITARKIVEEALKQAAYHDSLTGLPNRVLFNDRYIVALSGAKRYHKKICIMVLDIDYFKTVNDTLGHAAGDEVLKVFSGILLSVLRKTDTVMRSGGDEFVIMMTDVVELEQMTDVAQKVLEATRKPFMLHTHEINITASVGISSYPENGEDIETLLKCADIAMYHIKETGRNNYARYAPGMGDGQ